MVNVDKAVIARLKKNGKNFEVLVDCDKALEFKSGKDVDLNDVLATKDIFDDVKKGTHASSLHDVFGTEDSVEIAGQIIKKGDVQLTAEHKNRMREELRKKIVNLIHRNAINPGTNSPHPPQRIEAAIEEAKIKIDEFRSAEEQVGEVVNKIRVILPLKYELHELSLKIPVSFSGQSFGIVKQFSKILNEEWLSDGSLQLLVEVPSGLQNELLDKLNNLTKGDIESSVVRTK
jgi:ribosome maturation protein SDO1